MSDFAPPSPNIKPFRTCPDGLMLGGGAGAGLWPIPLLGLKHFSAKPQKTCSENPAKSQLLAFSLIRKGILLALAAFPNLRFAESCFKEEFGYVLLVRTKTDVSS